MRKKMEKYIFKGFGFPVILHNVSIGHTDEEEEYLDINLKSLQQLVARALIKSSVALTGAKLKFLRKFLNLSLRDLAKQLDVPHTSIKFWEDNPESKTGLESAREKQLKYLVLLHLQSAEQKELSKSFFSSELESAGLNEPLEIDDYKFGA